MAYATIDEWAKNQNRSGFSTGSDPFTDHATFPIQSKLEADLLAQAAIMNRWIKSYADISNAEYLPYLKQLNIEMVDRKYDKQVDRTSHEGRGIYNPHDYLYKDERKELIDIGVATGYRVAGGVSTA